MPTALVLLDWWSHCTVWSAYPKECEYLSGGIFSPFVKGLVPEVLIHSSFKVKFIPAQWGPNTVLTPAKLLVSLCTAMNFTFHPHAGNWALSYSSKFIRLDVSPGFILSRNFIDSSACFSYLVSWHLLSVELGGKPESGTCSPLKVVSQTLLLCFNALCRRLTCMYNQGSMERYFTEQCLWYHTEAPWAASQPFPARWGKAKPRSSSN